MTFLNPLLLFGMLAIAAPILIHLFMNRRIKPVVWAAMRFLQASVQKNKKQMNLEDALLLALRCLILILLALAMARPIFGGSAGNAGTGSSGETAIIALDNSYSMSQSDGSQSRFDQAKAAAEQVIDSLPGGSSVAVFLFSDIVRASIPEPTYDLNLARKVVRDAAISNRGTAIPTVLKEAMQTLARHPSTGQRIYLVTDGQASGWKPFGEINSMLRSASVKTSVILVGSPEDHNLCVSDLRMAASMANVDEAIQFDVEVSNFSVSEAKDVAVRLAVDDEAACDQGVIASIPPGGSKRVALFAKLHTAGYHTVTGEIDSDHLPCDDRRTIAVRATDDVRILLVDGEPSPDAGQSATFYLRNALVPVPLAARDQYAVKTKSISPAELDSTKLSDFEAVVLADVSEISPAAAEAMGAYLKRGGGLIIFPGPKTTAAFYNDTLGKKFGFLPASLGELRGKPDQTESFLTLQRQDYTHPIVSLWNDPSAGTLGSAHFYRSFELRPDPGHTAQSGEAQVVVKYSDGSPAVMERAWGRGRVILFSSSANTAWNDLAVRPAYLPLMDRTLGAILNHQDARLNVPVGSPFEFVCEPDWLNKDATILPPDQKKGPGALRRVGMRDGVPLLWFEETDKTGGYEATLKIDPPVTVKFAVQSNAAESNLEGLSEAQLTLLGTAAHVIHWTPATHLDEQFTKQRSGVELWIILAVLAIVACCAELVLAAKFSASK